MMGANEPFVSRTSERIKAKNEKSGKSRDSSGSVGRGKKNTQNDGRKAFQALSSRETIHISPNRYSVLSQDTYAVDPTAKFDLDSDRICSLCTKSSEDDNANFLDCQRCKKFFCIQCLGKPVDMLHIMLDEGLFWFCDTCKPKAVYSIDNDFNLEKRCAEIMEQFEMREIGRAHV